MTALPLCMIKIIIKPNQIDMDHFVSFKRRQQTKAMVVLKVLLFSISLLVYGFNFDQETIPRSGQTLVPMTAHFQAMFTLYRIVLSKQFLLRNSTAPLRC